MPDPPDLIQSIAESSRVAENELDRLRSYALDASTRLEEARQMYKQIIERAELVYQQNERAYQKLKEVRHKLIGARSLTELVRLLVQELGRLDVDQITMLLASDQLERFDCGPDEHLGGHLKCLPRDELDSLISGPDSRLTYIGGIEKIPATPHVQPEVQSLVLTPLIARGETIGGLILGSHSRERFLEDQAPDLLEDLAITAALCVDNVLSHEKNERLASTDPLTGLFNRRYFFESAEKHFALARRHQEDLACLYVDLNDFKPINDTWGHEVGDLALKKLAGFLEQRLRHTDVLARIGGDEFVILLPRVDLDAAGHLANVLKSEVRNLSLAEDGFPQVRLSASVGVATLSPEDTSLEQIIGRADQAMFLEKKKKIKPPYRETSSPTTRLSR